MRKVITTLILLKILIPDSLLYSSFHQLETLRQAAITHSYGNNPSNDLAEEALNILKAKCNVCHRKQNPFKIFSQKNMKKHAPKIYEQVFVKKRMPKGDEIKLTEEEAQTLKEWLKSQNNL